MPLYNNQYRTDNSTDDLIKTPPTWLIRNGMILMILIFIVLLIGAYAIKYPDMVQGKGVIEASAPPIRISTKSNGTLVLLKNDSCVVSKDEIIGSTTNEFSKEEIMTISDLNAKLDTTMSNETKSITFNKILNLLKPKTFDTELNNKIKHLNYLNVYAPVDRKNIQTPTEKLKSILNIISENYFLKSPIDGQLVYLRNLENAMPINAGEHLFGVIPESSDYYTHISVSPKDASMIEIGQKCLIQIDYYPYQIFGSLEGKVSKNSNIFNDSSYTVTLRVNKPFITNKKKTIPKKDKYFITANIIVNNRSLLERVLIRK